MANEMIERAARAIYAKVISKSWGCSWEESPHQELYLGYARAAIEAMREPTEDMLDHANETVRPDSDNAQCPAFYRAVIDAALKD